MTTEHVILVAFTVEADDRSEAEAVLAEFLPNLDDQYATHNVESYWIAEDDRTDRSDCDSAVFVHPGLQHQASALLARLGMSGEHNVIPEGRNTNGFRGVQV